MGLFWVSLTVSVVALAGSIAFLVVRTLEAWRRFRAFSGAVGQAAGAVAASADAVAARAEALAEGSDRLGESAARLRVSRARLAVLTTALDEARDAFGSVTGVVPRKQ